MKKLLSFFVLDLPRIILLILFFLYTVLGFFVVPLLIKNNLEDYIKEHYHETLTAQKIYFNPFNFALELHDFKISNHHPQEINHPYKLELAFLRVNLDIFPLLFKEVHFSEFVINRSKFSFSFYNDLTNTWTPKKVAIEKKEESKKATPWIISLRELNLNENFFHFNDFNYPKKVDLPLGPITLKAQNITTTIGKDSILNNLTISFADAGKIVLDGTVRFSPLVANLKIAASHVPLQFLSAYLSKTTYLELTSGHLNLKSHLKYNSQNILYDADIDIGDFNLISSKDQSTIFSFEKLILDNFHYSHNDAHLSMNQILLTRPKTAIMLRADGTLNYKELMVPTPKKIDKNSENSTKENSRKLNYIINNIAINDGLLHFKDAQIKPSFIAEIEELNGSIGPITTKSDQKWDISLDGKVSGQGKFKASGFLRPNDFKNELKLDLLFHNIEMTTFTPYSGHFAGYQIEKGKLFLDLGYTLKNNKIIGKNNILLDQFTLGEKVNSKFATNLPVKFALALLKDRKGQIKFKLPVAGDTNSPTFAMGNLIKTALVNMLVNIVTAPFDYISGMFADGMDIKTVHFINTQSEVSLEEIEKISAIKTILKERPDLKLEIQASASLAEYPEQKRKKITDDELRELSIKRAQKIQDLLTDQEIAPERLYILNVKTYNDESLHTETLFNMVI